MEVGDVTSNIAACLLLGMKARGVFKSKMLKKIVQSSYCQVFNREESDVGHTSDSYIQRTLEKEEHILNVLKHGMYRQI